MKQQMYNFQVPTVMINKVKRLARKDGVSAAHYIRELIKKDLKFKGE